MKNYSVSKLAELAAQDAAGTLAEQAISDARDYAENIIQTMRDPLLILRTDLRVHSANEAFYTMFNMSSQEIEGCLIYDLGHGQWNIPKLRQLLEDILPKNNSFNNFEVAHNFETIGHRTMLLNARTLRATPNHPAKILLGIEDITELLQFQAKLRRSEIRYRRLFEAARDGVLIIDPTTRKIVDANPFMTELLGYTHDELLGKELFEIGLHKDEESSRAAFEELQNKGCIRYEDLPLKSKTGRRREVEMVSNLYLEDGETIIQCNIRDIAERKEDEEQLRKGEGRFRAAVEAVSGIVWTNNAAGEMVGEQPGWAALTGQSYADYQGFGWTAKIHPYDTQPTIDAWNEALVERKTFEFEHRVKRLDGAWRIFSVRAIPSIDEAGNIVEWVGVHTDITEQRNVEEALRTSDMRFRQLADSINQMIWVTRPDGYHEYYNKRWYEYIGVAEGSTHGYLWHGIFHPDDRERSTVSWQHSLATGEPYEFEYRLRRADGVYRWTLGRAECVRNENGEIIKWYGTCTDIQDLVDARQKAEAANISKSEFLTNMSHEIRTPMNAVVGLSNILAMSKDMPKKQQEMISTLQLSAQSLLGLINDLLDISKIEANTIDLERIPFTLHEVIGEVSSILSLKAQEKNIALDYVNGVLDDQKFLGDPLRIRQVLINLVGNALKFTAHGSVTINITSSAHDNPEHIYAHIAVSDTGIGIAANKLKEIFEKFTQADSSITRKYGGTGLGLAISKNLAEIMGGSITIKSQLGEGSQFTLHLPLEMTDDVIAHSSVAEHTALETNELPTLRGCILLAEDYKPNVLVATSILESLGYDYDVANNGHQALEKIRANKGTYAAVLMDVQMPGMDGFEATRIIREEEKATGSARLHIIAMTAHALDGDRERCLKAGMDDYISKPFDPKNLATKLRAVTASFDEAV